MYPANRNYVERPTMGRSIGVAGQKSSGTFRGYIYNKSTGRIHGITNGHIVLMNRKASEETLSVCATQEDGVNVCIMQNLDEDHETLQPTVAQRQLESRVAKDKEYGSEHVSSRKVLEKAQEYVESLRALDRNFANVTCADLSLINLVSASKMSWNYIGLLSIILSM